MDKQDKDKGKWQDMHIPTAWSREWILGHILASQKTYLQATCTQSNSPDWHLCITTSTLPLVWSLLSDTLAKLIAAFIAASLTSFERLPSSDKIWHHSQSNLQTLRLSLTNSTWLGTQTHCAVNTVTPNLSRSWMMCVTYCDLILLCKPNLPFI